MSKAARDLKQLMDEKYPFMDVYLTGGVMIDTAFGDAPRRDMSALIPIMFAFLLFLIFFSLRSIFATLSTLIVIVLSTITGLGLAGWMGIVLTPASANAPIIILTLAVADSIHILVTVFYSVRLERRLHQQQIYETRAFHQASVIALETRKLGTETRDSHLLKCKWKLLKNSQCRQKTFIVYRL